MYARAIEAHINISKATKLPYVRVKYELDDGTHAWRVTGNEEVLLAMMQGAVEVDKIESEYRGVKNASVNFCSLKAE